ncbi:hypothetical protein [Halomicronema hongdechloris]|nr:hypothetical protein [Halomicronema hongdechloris]
MTYQLQLIGVINVLLLAAANPCVAQTDPSSVDPSDAEQLGIPQPAPIAQQTEAEAEVDRINYFGVGGTIGLSDEGETGLGDGGFSLVGRLSVTDHLSIHSASVLTGDSLASFAVTGGLPIQHQSTGRPLLFPFVGAGISVETDDFEVDPLVSGGVDVPITDLVTGTARINASFGNDGTDVGLVLGVGVDFLELL